MDIHLSHSDTRLNDKLLGIFFKVETLHWWWVARKKIVLNLLDKHLNSKNKNLILDAGCGTGAGMIYLSKFGKVYGVDLSPIAVRFCRKRGIKNVKVGSVLRLPYKDNTFDLICLMDVIEHIKDDKKVIEEMHRVLKPGGLLLMTLPALPFIYSKHDSEQGHYRRYTKNDIKKLFKKNRFAEKKLTYFNLFLSSPIILIRLLSRVGWPFTGLASFDSKVNYSIHNKKIINLLLTKIFSFESILINNFDLPFGISLLSLHEKI